MKPFVVAISAFACLSSALLSTAVAAGADPLATWHIRQPPAGPTSENYEGVAYGNGRWVIVGDSGSILSSPDGVEWTAETNPSAPARLDDVAFGNGIFVAVGRGPKMLLTSPDGRVWTKREPALSGCMEVLHDGQKFLILMSGGYIGTSTDGVEWTQPTRVPVNNDVGGLASANGIYVQAGYKRTGQPPDVFSSSNFSNWSPRDGKLDQNLMNAAYGLGLFIIMGQGGALATSSDGIEWTKRTVPHSGFIWDVATGGNRLVAAAQWGRVLTSTNGVEWTKHETGLDWHLTDIAFGNGRFVAVGWDGQIVQSESVAAGSSVPVRLTDCRATPGQFSFKFNGEVGKTYQVHTSTDLVHWSPLKTVQCTETSMAVSDAAAAGPRFYRVSMQ